MSAKTIVITGASSGIGASAAKQLAGSGATVCLLARRESELQAVQHEITRSGGKAWIYPVDLTDRAAVAVCVDKILAEHAKIDVLVNNAGHSIRRPITQSLDRLHDYERTMTLNFMAPVHLTFLLLPHFIANHAGHIVNVSSMSTQVAIPLFSAYLASKSALESFSRSLNVELGDKGIRASTVFYPLVRTPMSSRTSIYHYMPMMQVDIAAKWIVKAVKGKSMRVSSIAGIASSVWLAAFPEQGIRVMRPMFRLMDSSLKRQQRRRHKNKTLTK